ncbi:MAG TPA: hypothetical protein VFI25_00990 [Planctomycetota bacterium]|nr:hypothetical protein [Planctomycetota bacterium]
MAAFLSIWVLCAGAGGDVVVRMTDGSVLRGSLDPEGGGCRIRTEAGERFVPPEDIVWTARETDLLREARELVEGAGAGHAGATRHAQASLWCADMGLEEEAYRLLDRAVALDAGAPAVARTVGRMARKVAEEAQRAENPAERILRSVPSAGARRLVAEEAVALLDPGELLPVLYRSLVSPRTPTRQVASSLIGQRFPGEALKRLATVAIVDTDETVRANAVDSLKRAEGGRSCAALAPQLLAAPTPVHRRRAVAALERIGAPAAVPPLAEALRRIEAQAQAAGGPRGYVSFTTQTSYVRDFDVEVAQAAAIADPQIGVLTEGAVLDARVLSVRSERVAILGALSRIVGSDLGESPEAWESWYRARAR